MSDIYRTEEEQIEALKKWWKGNGRSTIVSVVVAVALVFGWQAWQKQQQANVEAASIAYQDLITIVATNNGQLSPEQQATATHLAERLKTDFSGSTYALFGAFYKAKFAVAANDLSTAEQELRWVLENNPSVELALQAKLRLARVLYSQKSYDQALAMLTGDAVGYAAIFEETKGDIYRAQGNTDQALQAYLLSENTAMQSDTPVSNPLLRIKIEQLNSELLGATKVSDNG